jgi:hypothetical protein
VSTPERQRVYPIAPPREFAAALADDPILIDGMKVVFDLKVGLYPVSLKKPDGEREYDRGGANGA